MQSTWLSVSFDHESVKNRIGDSQLTIEFLDRYKPLAVTRWLKGGKHFQASRKAIWPCNSIFMWVQAPPLRCRGANISPSLATGPQRAEAGVNGGIGKPQS